MKGILNNALIFTAGAAIGSLAAWRILKPYYKRIADEEIESVKEVYSTKYNNAGTETEKKESVDTEDIEEEPTIIDDIPADTYGYAKMLYDQKYSDIVNSTEKEDKSTVRKRRLRVIPPEEFGEADYETASLTYYADDVLTNEYDEVMDDDEIEYHVGHESLTHFGEYEDDSVFVRNDEIRCDYEILRDSRKYSDVYPAHLEE